MVTDTLKEHSSRILRSVYLPFLDITAEMKLRSLKKEGKFWCMRVHLRALSKSDKLAQTMFERDIGSCYVTSCILLWYMNQIKIVWPATTKWFNVATFWLRTSDTVRHCFRKHGGREVFFLCKAGLQLALKQYAEDAHSHTILLLTPSWRRLLSYKGQSIDLQCKLMNWFLYYNGVHHKGV